MTRLIRLMPVFLLASCAKPVAIDDARSQVGAGLLVAAPIARIVAHEADAGDGAIGCIVGETIGEAFRAAGAQLATGQPNPEARVDICECLSMRDEWQTIDIADSLASQASSAIQAVGLLVRPYIRDCEAAAWFTASTNAVATLIEPLTRALSLEQCVVPIPPIVPALEACSE